MSDVMDNGMLAVSLISSAVNKTALPKLPDNTDFKALYSFAYSHHIANILYVPLKEQNISEADLAPFYEEYKKYAVREAVFDAECDKLLASFDKNDIYILPLKGYEIKKYYPESFLRSFVDLDLYTQKENMPAIRRIMEEHGYYLKHEGENEHDYIKKPYFNIEVHNIIPDECMGVSDILKPVFSDIPQKNGSKNIHEMTIVHLYIYTLIHFYKHFIGSGAGVRFLLDIYLLHRSMDTSQKKKVNKHLANTAFAEFNNFMSALSYALFSSFKLTKEQEKVVKFIFSSGVFGGSYGYILQDIVIKCKGKKRNFCKYFYYIWYRNMLQSRRFTTFPVLKKHYCLLPLCAVKLFADKAVLHAKKTYKEYRSYKKYEAYVANLFNICGIKCLFNNKEGL